MLKLTDRQWKEFKIKDIFDISTGSLIDKNSLNPGNTPRISASGNTNGIIGFFSSKNKKYRTFENIISISFLGNAFYQKNKISLDMKIHGLKLKDLNLNRHIANFIITAFNKTLCKFSYGNQLSSSDLPKQTILFPINNISQPDYEFMENYMKEKEAILLDKYLKYAESLTCGGGGILPLYKKEWKEFKVGEFLNTSVNCKPFHLKNLKPEPLGIPYISRTNLNNGLFEIVKKEKDFILNPKNSICFGAENAKYFYQPFNYLTGNKMYYYRIANKFIGLFITSALNKSLKNCGFGYAMGLTGKRSDSRFVLLPCLGDQPDYEYMEQYMMNKEAALIKKYLKFLQEKIA